MRQTCLVVNIGNTCSSAALMAGRRVIRVRRLLTRGSTAGKVRAAIRRLTRGRPIQGAALCSVVPKMNRLWIAGFHKETGLSPLVVSRRIRLGFRLDYPRPETIGADRLANVCAVAGRQTNAAIVADFGTAATFDVLTADGRFIGGVIAPGPALMTEYLADRAALLPRIRLAGSSGGVGRSTAGAMRIAARVGYPAMVRAITSHIIRRLRLPDLRQRTQKRVRLVATGGYARWVAAGLDIPFKVEPDLTFQGLYRLYHLNLRPPARTYSEERFLEP
ncbi:MAG: type III pantothenate kinase [Verrucomicrobiota bacterium]|nr:type III pantothenate kinase [Verrucomicrobiota bacterium]